MWGTVDAAVRCAVPLALRLLHARQRIGDEALSFAHALRALPPIAAQNTAGQAQRMLEWFEQNSEFSRAMPYEFARCVRCLSDKNIDDSGEFLYCRRCGSEEIDVPSKTVEDDRTLLQTVIGAAQDAAHAARNFDGPVSSTLRFSASARRRFSVVARRASSEALRDTLALAIYPIEGRVPLRAHLLLGASIYEATIRVLCDEVDTEPRLLLPASLPLLEQITDAAVARAIAWQGRR
jgi:hypothetical protein